MKTRKVGVPTDERGKVSRTSPGPSLSSDAGTWSMMRAENWPLDSAPWVLPQLKHVVEWGKPRDEGSIVIS